MHCSIIGGVLVHLSVKLICIGLIIGYTRNVIRVRLVHRVVVNQAIWAILLQRRKVEPWPKICLSLMLLRYLEFICLRLCHLQSYFDVKVVPLSDLKLIPNRGQLLRIA